MFWSQQFQSQEMEHNGTSPTWCYFSCRRCFVFILILATTLFVYSTILMNLDWNPKSWFTYINDLSNTNFTALENATQMPQSSTQPVVLTPVPYVFPGPYRVEYPYDYHFPINHPERCNQLKPFLVLIVPVAPGNSEHRINIRGTWGNQTLVQDKVVSLFFLLGQPSVGNAAQIQQQVMEENNKYGDLLQSDFLDSYKNLTIKTMVMMEWLQSYCNTAAYAMKIDSDMFLNVHNLISMLLPAKKENYLTGLVAHGAAVLRDKSSKWYLPPSIFPEGQYPPYALGLGYIFSLDLPKKIVEASRHVPTVYIEDVYVGLCMRHLQILPTEPPPYKFHVFPLNYNRCTYSTIIATTTQASTNMREVWKDFTRQGPYC